MLDMGFLPDIKSILKLLPPHRQNLVFSATLPADIMALVKQILHNPVTVEIGQRSTPAVGIRHAVYPCPRHLKPELLIQLLRGQGMTSVLIFTRTKSYASRLTDTLTRAGFKVSVLHGDRSQSQRLRALEQFRKGRNQVMVATDIAARGIDIDDISHVINFDMPNTPEDYVHRIGRTARAGREGRAFTVATPEDGKYVAEIENLIGAPLPRISVEGLETAELTTPSRRRRKTGDRRRDAGTAAPVPERSDADRQPASRPVGQKGRPSRPSRREEPDRPVVGMGDHVPAFMLREPKLSKKGS
jgi:ATP-dependent RNA helicase RhlE